MMKACVLHTQKQLSCDTVPAPVISEPSEVLVRILRGGICGSDMHYYLEGGVGSIRVREPIIIGHEGCGIVEAVGSAVTGVQTGDMVAIRPARPCFECLYCKKGMFTYCEKMRHLGSAALLPHTSGLFAERVVIHEAQTIVVNNMAPEVAAFAEPLGVAYAAVHKLGDMVGKSVLVMGAGPIGALSAAAAKVLGAGSVTVVDVRQAPLDMAAQMGVDTILNSATHPEQIEAWKAHKGSFDCCVEATGNRFAAVDGMAMTRPEGVIAQVGTFAPGNAPQDLGPFATKSLKWHSSFRFYDEFGPAVSALQRGLINPLPLLSASFPMTDCVAAMESAISPETAKVQVIVSE